MHKASADKRKWPMRKPRHPAGDPVPGPTSDSGVEEPTAETESEISGSEEHASLLDPGRESVELFSGPGAHLRHSGRSVAGRRGILESLYTSSQWSQSDPIDTDLESDGDECVPMREQDDSGSRPRYFPDTGDSTRWAPHVDPQSRLSDIMADHVPVRLQPTANKERWDTRCRVCFRNDVRRETKYQCGTCSVPLCRGECFQSYHTNEFY